MVLVYVHFPYRVDVKVLTPVAIGPSGSCPRGVSDDSRLNEFMLELNQFLRDYQS